MSGEQDDPVEILSDDGSDATQPETLNTTKKESTKGTKLTGTGAVTGTPSTKDSQNKNTNMANESEPQPSTSKDKNDESEEVNGTNDDAEDDNPAEYNVEAIRAKRKNKHGVDEYYIKWEGYSESENTWEPLENLKCPELISRFNEQEANKRRKKKAERLGATQASATKRPRREAAASTGGGASSQNIDNNDDTESLFVEGDDDENDYHIEQTRKKSKGNQNKEIQQNNNVPAAPRGFDRNLPVEKIVTASVGDDDKLYFFLKWQGRNEMELVDADELEKKCPYTLCRWYRDRLYWESSEQQQQQQQQLNATNAQ